MSKIRVAMIGVGGMARHHIRQMLKQDATTEIVAFCEPSPEQAKASAAFGFSERICRFVQAIVNSPAFPLDHAWKKRIPLCVKTPFLATPKAHPRLRHTLSALSRRMRSAHSIPIATLWSMLPIS